MFGEFIEDGYFLMKNDNGMVDLYEILSVLSIVNKAEFEEKLEFVFSLFDFDKNNMLEQHEFIMSI
jgi:Ca2+-binding EF-hand superfamily protein